MVKFKLSPSKKRYLRGKNVYQYIRLHLPVPHKFYKKLEPYFQEEFLVDTAEENGKVTITYTYIKKQGKETK